MQLVTPALKFNHDRGPLLVDCQEVNPVFDKLVGPNLFTYQEKLLA